MIDVSSYLLISYGLVFESGLMVSLKFWPLHLQLPESKLEELSSLLVFEMLQILPVLQLFTVRTGSQVWVNLLHSLCSTAEVIQARLVSFTRDVILQII